MQKQNYKQNKKSKRNYSNKPPSVKINLQELALQLKPEFKGQQVCVLKVNGFPVPITTTVGAGYSASVPISGAGMIPNFIARFVGFTEYRIIKAKQTALNYSANNPGIANMWFSEDDSSSPSSTTAYDAKTLQYNYADIIGKHSQTYVPLDPVQQEWTLVSTGTKVVGYLKHYTNVTNFGCPSAATPLGSVKIELTVQFRGLQ